jgi:TetR/AcrR family acrAB operon transcriptional repressor
MEVGRLARKTKELALETREKLLESALDVMSEKPFDKVSISEIASRVGLSKGAVYWHFKNKSDLLVNLIRRICEDASADSSYAENPPRDFAGLRCFLLSKLKITDKNERQRKISKLLHRQREWPEDVHLTVMTFISERTKYEKEIIAGVILRCQERGEVSADFPADEIAMMLSAIFHGMFFLQLHEVFSMDFAKHTNFIFDVLEKELKNGTGNGLGGARASAGLDTKKYP